MVKKANVQATAKAKPQLDSEFANRLKDPFESAYMGVLRTNDPLLLERGQGSAELYRDLKRDGKVFSGLQKRQLALVGKSWQVEPRHKNDANASKDAQVLTAILKGFAFDRMCADLMDALLTGIGISEIIWTVRDGQVVPKRVIKRATRRFVFVQQEQDAPAELRLLTRENMVTGVPVPDRKFIVHRVNPEDDNPYGTGLGLQVFWAVFFKRKGIVAWNKLNDRFGTPTPHGEYPRNATREQKATMADALKAMSSDGYLLTPEGMKLALLESRLSGNVTTQQALTEAMDDWIAEVLTGQEPARSSGGAIASASKERQNVRQDLTQADSDLLSETLNETLIAWICEFNGLAPCMVYRQIKEEEDTKALAETDKVISEMGFELDEDSVRAKYGDGWRKAAYAPGAPAVPAVPSSGLPSFAEPGAQATQTAATTDALDALIAAEQSQWQPALEPLLAPVRKALADAAAKGLSAGEVLGLLPQLLTDMDPGLLADSLTRAAFTARLGGDADIPNE